MVFIEYENLKAKYVSIQQICDQILQEKEKYFVRTQPDAIRYDKLNVAGGEKKNHFDEYLQNCESKRIDERLNEAVNILHARAELLKIKEQELRESKDIYDIVYTMKNLDNIKIHTIARALNYSESQIYRIIDKIQKRG